MEFTFSNDWGENEKKHNISLQVKIMWNLKFSFRIKPSELYCPVQRVHVWSLFKELKSHVPWRLGQKMKETKSLWEHSCAHSCSYFLCLLRWRQSCENDCRWTGASMLPWNGSLLILIKMNDFIFFDLHWFSGLKNQWFRNGVLFLCAF